MLKLFVRNLLVISTLIALIWVILIYWTPTFDQMAAIILVISVAYVALSAAMKEEELKREKKNIKSKAGK